MTLPKLEEQPFIESTDLVSYVWKGHEMHLTVSSQNRVFKYFNTLEGKPKILSKPFVVVADGKRKYLGMFLSFLSSFHPFDIPVIMIPLNKPGFSKLKEADIKDIDRRDDPNVRISLLKQKFSNMNKLTINLELTKATYICRYF